MITVTLHYKNGVQPLVRRIPPEDVSGFVLYVLSKNPHVTVVTVELSPYKQLTLPV